MEENDNVELIQLAIQRLIEEDKNKKKKKKKKIRDISFSSVAITDDDDDDHILLSRLLSQLESLKGDDGILEIIHEPPPNEEEEIMEEVKNSPGVGVGVGVVGEVKKSEVDDEEEVKKDEIVKELRNLKKQNRITHCLLSVMIVLTLAWQFSEVSLILKVTNRLTNPFKSVGDMFNGIFKRPRKIAEDWSKRESSLGENQPNINIEVPSIPPLKIPDLPNVGFSKSLGLNGDED